MSEICNEKTLAGFEEYINDPKRPILNGHRIIFNQLFASHRALQAQVRELEGYAMLVTSKDSEIGKLKARITTLESTLAGYRHSMKIVGQHLTDAQQHITALEAELDKSQALLRASCEEIRKELTGLETHIYNTLYGQIPYLELPNKSPAYFRVTEASRVMKHYEQRITQLEGALKPFAAVWLARESGMPFLDAVALLYPVDFKQAQHALKVG
jgi:chromosome segregation ATPase